MKIKVKLESNKVTEKVLDKNTVLLGRSQKCDFVIIHENISREHCLLEIENGQFFVTDLSSSNGVYIDGKKISPQVRTRFSTFQELLIGNLECTVVDEDNSATYDSYQPPPKTRDERTVMMGPPKIPFEKEKVTQKKSLPKHQNQKDSKSGLTIFVLVVGAGIVWFFFRNLE